MIEQPHQPALLRFVIDHCDEGAFAMDEAGRIRVANASACRILDFDADELLAMHVWDIEPDLCAAEWRRLWRLMVRQGSLIRETAHQRRDASRIPVEIAYRYARFGGNDYACAVARDISERLMDQTLALQAKEDWERTFDAVPEWVCVLDSEYRIRRANRSMAQALNRPEREWLGQPCYRVVHGADAPPAFCPYRHTLEDGASHEQEAWLEWSQRWVAITTTPLARTKGNPPRTVHIMRDITERKRAEEERLDQVRRSQEADHLERLGVLAGGIAHDFNNILAGMMGYANLSKSLMPEGSPVRTYLTRIEEGAQRAAALCQEILSYAGLTPFDLRAIDLNGLLENTVLEMRMTLPPEADLSFHPEEMLPPFEGDFVQIQQVIANLVRNAAESLTGGKREIRIASSLFHAESGFFSQAGVKDPLPPGEYLAIDVTDAGCGMERDTLERIFEPFFSTKFQGRGLGLPVVMGIVRRHRGAVLVQSAKDTGTSVRVLLPALRPGSEQSNAAAHTYALLDEWQPGGLVLLVDDETVLRQVGTKILEQLGFDVELASNGAEAVEYMNANGGNVRAILMDVVMPVMDGVKAALQIRRRYPDVPVLLASGHSGQSLESELAGNEGFGFIHKPYRIDQLREKLQALLWDFKPPQSGV